MKRNCLPCLALALCLLGANAFEARAQRSMAFGVHAIYDLDWESLGLGGQLRMGTDLGGFALVFNPSVEYYFLEDGPGFNQSLLQLNGDFHYVISTETLNFAPYALAGLGFSRYSIESEGPGDFDGDDNDIFLNVGAGANFNPQGAIRPFAQLYVTLAGGSRVGLKGGILIGGGP